MNDARETIARALYLRRTGTVPFMWDNAGDNTKGMFLGDADAAIEALGLVGDALPGWCEHRWNDFVGEKRECDCKPLRRRYVTPWRDET